MKPTISYFLFALDSIFKFNTFLLYIDSVGTSQIDIHIQRPSMRPYKIGRLYESDSEDEY